MGGQSLRWVVGRKSCVEEDSPLTIYDSPLITYIQKDIGDMRRRSVLRIWMVSLLLSAPANAYDIGAGIDLKGSVELKNFTSFQTKDTADSLRFRDELVLQL